MQRSDVDFLCLQTPPQGDSLKDFPISKVQGPSPHVFFSESDSGNRRVADALRRHAPGIVQPTHENMTRVPNTGNEIPVGVVQPTLSPPTQRNAETASGGGGSASSNGAPASASTAAGGGVSPPSSSATASPLLQIIDRMRNERRQREEVFLQRIRTLESELVVNRQEGETQRLKIQELQECAHRLGKENTVLSSQLAELQRQLEAVGDLCLRRGRALQEAGLQVATEAARTPERATPSEVFRGSRVTAGTPAGIPASFSIRSMVMAAGSPSHYTPSHALIPGGAAGLPVNVVREDHSLNRSAKSDGPSFDYNDLVPITIHELDPEVLAAMKPPEATTVSQVVALMEEVQMLRQQIDAQRSAYEKERNLRMLEERRQHREFAEERENFAATLKRTEELSECCLQELVSSRQTYEQKLHASASEITALKKNLMEALDFAEKVQRENNQTVAHAEGAAEMKFKQRIADMKSGIALRKKRWEEERRQLVELLEDKQARLTSLSTQLSAAREKLRKEEQRFALEKQGAESELQLMRQSLRQLEKKLYFAKAREDSPGTVGSEIPLSKFYLA